jgi:hypothetical protein
MNIIGKSGKFKKEVIARREKNGKETKGVKFKRKS